MEDGLFDRPPALEMLHYDPLEQFRRDTGVPDALRIDHNDRPAGADAEARRLTAFLVRWTEQEILALEKARQLRVEAATPTFLGAKAARTNDHVPAIRLHESLRLRHH